LLPKGFQGRSRGPAKDTPMPKLALVMLEYQNNLMRNQCMEQCAIYTFFTCGSYLGWAFWLNISFLAILGSSVERGNYQEILQWLAVFGTRS